MINSKKKCIGTLQALNKKSGSFTDDDREIVTYLSSYITVAIENAKLYEELSTADRAKERAISHLSHELRTPLSIILSAFGLIEKKANPSADKAIIKAAKRGQRSVARLMEMQEKAEDVIKLRPIEESEFSGFYHTRDTNYYSSQKAYDFGAGGMGLDLLRIKIFAKMYGFALKADSKRCKYIPEDIDQCEGRISNGSHIKDLSQCLASGGSKFTLIIPFANEGGSI